MSPNAPATNKFQGARRTKKVFDIVPPGKALASATSRPVIVSDKPAVEDQQMVGHRTTVRIANPADEDRPLMKSGEKVRLSPISPDLDAPSAPIVPKKKTVAVAEEMPATPEKLTPADAKAVSGVPELEHFKEQFAAAQDEPAPAQSFAVSDGLLPEPLPETDDKPPLPEPAAADDDEDDELFKDLDVGETKKSQPVVTSAPELQPEAAAEADDQTAEAATSGAASEAGPSESDGRPSEPSNSSSVSVPESTSPEAKPADPDTTSADAADQDTTSTPEFAKEMPIAKPTYRREDLLSGAGMVMPTDDTQRMVVSHHNPKRGLRAWQWLLVISLVVIIALAAVNFLIDAEVIKTDLSLPTTNLL